MLKRRGFHWVMANDWDFEEHTNKQCLGKKTEREVRTISHPSQGLLESEVRGCQVHCANDPACNAVSYQGNKCFFQKGRVVLKNGNNKKCYVKTMSGILFNHGMVSTRYIVSVFLPLQTMVQIVPRNGNQKKFCFAVLRISLQSSRQRVLCWGFRHTFFCK